MDAISCKSVNEYLAAVGNSQEKLMVVEFYADWSIPSQVLSQDLFQLLVSYPNIQHLRLNFNDCPDLFQRYKVSILPCVKLIKGGQELGEIRGNLISKLKEIIELHY